MASRGVSSVLRAVGSLWFAALLLAVLGVCMAAATVIESRSGTERALASVYHAGWFRAVLGLLAINLLAAVLSRPLLVRRYGGFLLTHLAVLLIFGGAMLTRTFGVDGRLTIAEGETASTFVVANRPTLSVTRVSAPDSASISLDPAVFTGLRECVPPVPTSLSIGSTEVAVLRYLPDAEASRRMVEDPNRGRLAVEVALSAAPHDFNGWIFAGETSRIGAMPVAFRSAAGAEELRGWLEETDLQETASKGTLKLEHDGQTYSISVEECLDRPAPVGETGYTAQVTRYLPHAIVGEDKSIVSASSQPVNPYVEVAISGPEGTQTRRAFAKFPDFADMHGGTAEKGFKLRYEAPEAKTPPAPIEVQAGPDGEFYVRFSQPGMVPQTRPVTLGSPLETPWEGWRFEIRRRLSQARWEETVTAVTPPRQDGRQPAVELAIRTPDATGTIFALYGRQTPVEVGGQALEVRFSDGTQPLDFEITLDTFRVVTHPGIQKPRSYESRVTIRDPRAGGELSRVISMNHPLDYGGYTFYQSSYHPQGAGFISVLSVSRDPGRNVVFAGYVVMLIGMIWVLVRRIGETSRAAPAAAT